ncbi:MAG: PASTA domain-containing protein [Ignavibacteria bacterium]|nr:PASTA domain-containing protein [Ignavibacteria bacterium]
MINKRALLITGIIIICFIGLAVRLFNIQVINHDYYSLIAIKQQNKPQIVKAERGLIKDTNGEILAYTQHYVSFYADTRMLKNPKAIQDKKNRIDSITILFSKKFGKSKAYYKKLIDDGVKDVCLEKKVPIDIAIEIKKNVIDGLFYIDDFTRVYPYGSLASHVLGYVNKEFIGKDGIERQFDKFLTGSDGYYVYESDVLGRIISIDENLSRNPNSGANVELTINKTYQQILEEELEAGVKNYQAESAIGIIAVPNTGEILALANVPFYDPANYELFPADALRNRTLTDPYEPGSTIKSIIMSILFEEKLAVESEILDTENGKYKIRTATISDTHPHERLTIREILEQSSNIGMAKLSDRIPNEMIYKYLRDFGFTNLSSIDLPGEASGYLKKPSTFSALTKPFLSFGYEISVTPLQLIMAYSAIVNGGLLFQPFILKRITDSNGKEILNSSPMKIRNVINKNTSQLMKNIMVGVIENGTGKAAQLDNVLVGGKTGTSQQLVDNSYSSSKHNSSFIGFFPAENPKVICLILLKAPQIGKYGGLVSAPVFQKVAKRMVESDLNLIPSNKTIDRNKNLVDQLITEIKTTPKRKSNTYMNIASSDKKLNSRSFFNGARTTMPNLIDNSLRDALAKLNELGLEYKVVGTGRVIEQSIESGVQISAGDTCVIKCIPPNKVFKERIN